MEMLEMNLDDPKFFQSAAQRQVLAEGVNTDFVDASGDSPLAHMGEYIAFYLAAAYGIDPTPLPPREAPKSPKQAG
jgi:hypothetical protein